jgi:UPF0755 protein
LSRHEVVVRARERRWLGLVAAGAAVVGLIVVVVYGTVTWRELQRINPPGDPEASEIFEVVEGDDLESIGERLLSQGFVVDDGTFVRYANREGGLDVVPGLYTLRPLDHMGNLLRVLRTPPNETFWRVTIPEGFTIEQIAERLADSIPGFDAEAFVDRATRGGEPAIESSYAPGVVDLEGLLFPDTFSIAGDETPAQVVQRMVRLMERVGRQEGLDDAAVTVGLDPYRVLIIASMIEREAKTEKDRALISRVIYNRLAMGMKLEIDATLYYGQDTDTAFDVLKAVDSPYNTYLYGGLPPTPIASPGRASIAAALAPAPNPSSGDPICRELPAGVPCAYLFYVLDDLDGNHAFAVTLEQHEENVRRSIEAGIL